MTVSVDMSTTTPVVWRIKVQFKYRAIKNMLPLQPFPPNSAPFQVLFDKFKITLNVALNFFHFYIGDNPFLDQCINLHIVQTKAIYQNN